ncbi:MAG: TrkA family potassium uptake protein [Muribaculaceae bacterium]|nr:TrkA family potassium uptake protein [Muribaculaceae bacterium]MDE5930254.1 TrkA family potassium uptake protein [Muribaculaceae bacterium]
MRYLIIGLGIYGSNLARDLTDMGHEVIGADMCQSSVEAIKEYISTVYLIDTTEEAALGVLPLKNVDLVIVAIGENFGASVKTVALLKQNGVKHIYARAVDKLHESILQGFDIDRIITPEQRAASDLSHEMELGTAIESLAVDEDHFVLKFTVPDFFVGLAYTDLELERNYRLSLVAAARPKDKLNLMGIARPVPEILDINNPSQKVSTGDILTVFGSRRDFHNMYRHIK